MKNLSLLIICMFSLNIVQAQFNPRIYPKDFKYIPPAATITAATWKSAFNQVFSKSAVRFNNYTPVQNQYDRNERQFFKPDDSYIQLWFNNRMNKLPIPIDVIQVGPNSMFKMYVNDWNSQQISISPENGSIKISLYMEDGGTEIVGNCYNNFACGFTPTPAFNYTNSRIDIFLKLIAENGKVSYNATTVFNADVAESGPCVNNLFAFLCPSNRAGLFKSNIENTIAAYLNHQMFKPLVSALLFSQVQGLASVSSVQIATNGDIQVWN